MTIQRQILDSSPEDSAVVSDTSENFNPDTTHPLSITPEGNLRVSVTNFNVLGIWSNIFDNPWKDDLNPWKEEIRYV